MWSVFFDFMVDYTYPRSTTEACNHLINKFEYAMKSLGAGLFTHRTGQMINNLTASI